MSHEMNASQLSAGAFLFIVWLCPRERQRATVSPSKAEGSEKTGSPVPSTPPCAPQALPRVAASFLGAALRSRPLTPGQLSALTGFLETFLPFNHYCFVFVYF
ncbi:unnamed protein product [Rangifer tarandus platyrhynchus]|uniref:Uncharacterized protein n=2 Tax=Rangifer tarandus platyrhynchus TaxID=3082113 RepID=A0AC59ZRS9_RANTA|nr:unnamed protein product [Rangifer tarandus platyrhynchus]